MRNPSERIALCLALSLLFAALAVSTARGDEGEARQPTEQTSPQAAETAAADAGFKDIDVKLVHSVLGETAPPPNGTRYLVVRLRLTNNSRDEVVVPLGDVRLRVDGQELRPKFHPQNLQGFAFENGRESLRFRDLEQPEEVRLGPSASQTVWVAYTDVPGFGDVPSMKLEIGETDGHRISVNDVHRDRLKLTHEIAGPRGILGLFTIRGSLDTINVGTLVEELNQASNQGVTRVVISFTDSADQLPGLISQWLEQTTQQRDRSRIQSRFPALSPTIRELHLAAMPDDDGRVVQGTNGRPQIHRTEAAAVEWALEPIFRVLKADDVVEQIQRGHPLVRAAALATGARQLTDEHLPMILAIARTTDDPLLKRAALLALTEFRQPEAVDFLIEQAREGPDVLRTLAIECLAASRFEAAHDALERLLSDDPGISMVELCRILARYPRQRWIEPLRQLADGDWSDEHAPTETRSLVRCEALDALARIGHRELVDILGRALDTGDEQVRQTAFALLVDRTDEDSERLAIDYALELTKTQFPNQQILSLFGRVRDARAVPLLVKHLDSSASDRSQLIKTLAQIGPDSIAQTLTDRYDALNPREKATVLSCLTDLGSPKALTLAQAAIDSEDNVLFNPSVRALQQAGTPEAVTILADALLATSHSSRINSLVRALEQIGTHDAINALRRARYAGDSRTEQWVARRLADILQRSPGFQQLDAANDHAQNEQWPEAVKAYTAAIEIDPELSEAYSGRGHCRLHLEQLQEAADDFRHALRRNNYDSLAVTGLAIVLVREGNLEEGMRTVDDASDRFPHDWLFAYNTACVYGRAIENILANPPSDERDRQVIELQEKAITQLRMAAERGFNQFDFMKRDPDLAPLRLLEAFQQLEAPAAQPPNP